MSMSMCPSMSMYVCTQVEELVAKLPSLERVVVLGMTADDPSWAELGDLVMSWEAFLASGSAADGAAPPIHFTRVPFAHPQFVLYSSGTTGNAQEP
jgi:acetoacetyl-CoA synthetase